MTRAYRLSTLALGCCLLVPAILRADPVVAPAMATPASVTFPFSVRITQAFGPLHRVGPVSCGPLE